VRECWLVHQAMEEIEVVQFAGGECESRRFFVKDDIVRFVGPARVRAIG
jgi:hypothetical protein